MNTTDKLLEKIKNNKLVAVIIVAAACLLAVITFFEKILSFYGAHVAQDLELVSMNLSSESAQVFSDHENLSCRFDQTTIRAFQPKHERLPSGRLGIVFTFANKGTVPVVFEAATLEVEFVESLAGGGPGVVESNHTYLLNIDFKTGSQRFPLTPNYNIPKTDTGAFTLGLTPGSPGIGKCWIARVIFDTTAGEISTESFQMVLSRN